MTVKFRSLIAAATVALAMAAPVLSTPVWATDPAPAAAPATANMQGDESMWIKDPHIHAFYHLAVAAFANGPANVDKARFERDAFAIFRDFGRTTGMGADAMQEHLKLIPDQVIQIATEDPKVLTSYDAFIAAVMGPQ